MSVEPEPKPLKVAQINLHHCKAAALNLQAVVSSGRVDMALIQEPWQMKGRVMGLDIPGYRILTPTSSTKVSTCIVLRQSIACTFLQSLSTPDLTVTGIDMQNGGTKLLLAAAYFPYDSKDPPPGQDFENLVQYCTNRRLNLVVGADANAHHICWGSTDTNSRGESLLDFLSVHNLVVSNVGNKPTFANKLRSEVLDLTIVTASSCGYVTDWKVSDVVSLSDHRYIFYKIALQSEVRLQAGNIYRNIKHTNWVNFETQMNKNEMLSH